MVAFKPYTVYIYTNIGAIWGTTPVRGHVGHGVTHKSYQQKIM